MHEFTFSLADLLPSWHIYRDRGHAGAQLGERLEAYRGHDVLVLGIPRGGVAVAAEVARRLNADLDIVVARKLGAPFQPELAIGAVTANGGRYLNDALVLVERVTDEYIEAVTAREMAEARRQEERLRVGRAASRVEGRTVIVVDDGLATGATMRAAVHSLRQLARRVVVAVPVAPSVTCDALRAEADEVIALHEPEPFLAVGLYYKDFRPTEEREIQRLMRASARRARGAGRPHRTGRQPEAA